MKQVRLILVAAMGLFISCSYPSLAAYAIWVPTDLTIIQLKMTGIETAVIENTTTSSINLQNYLVQYFNKHNPASLAVPTDSQQLANITLLPQQTILLSSESAQTCGAAAVADLNFALSDTSGYLRIVRIDSGSGGSLVYVPQDFVSWTSSSSGAGLTSVPSNTAAPLAVWYRQLASGVWQQAILSGNCSVVLAMSSASSSTTYVDWADGTAAPATFSSLSASAGSASNKGLAAPQITELLPNPATPLTDAEDEFIELYNPNSKSFDLGGFTLEVGLNTKRKHTFDSGLSIPAKSFKAFSSEETGLALSNSGSQVWLVDPAGTVIAQTEKYGKAESGQAWALGNGKWYWTISPTNGAANIIGQPGGTKKTVARPGGAVKGSVGVGSTGSPGGEVDGATKVASVHPWTLAAVGGMAILYGAYEYRNDLANNLHRLRRYREARRTAGKAP